MRDAEPEVGRRIGGAGDARQVVVLQVRVVDAGEGDRGAPTVSDPKPLVRSSQPEELKRSLRSGHGSWRPDVWRLPVSGST